MLSRSAVSLLALGCLAGANALHAPSSSIAPRAPIDAGLRRVAAPGSAMNLRGGAAKAAAPAPKPWYAAFWNETVELGVLFGLWYWGNAYCKIPLKIWVVNGRWFLRGAPRGCRQLGSCVPRIFALTPRSGPPPSEIRF
jgi:hypothetical protein